MDLSAYLRDLLVLQLRTQLQHPDVGDASAWLQYYQHANPPISDKPFWQPWTDAEGASLAEDAASAAKGQKQLPTTKWKRDRRTRPDYQLKSDPGQADSTEKSSSSSTSPPPPGKANGGLGDTPLDMSTRQRGLPPSYSQAISDPSFRSAYTSTRPRPPSVKGREDLPSGISMCDPIIDEHFRRSLGKDYNTVFNNNVKESAKAGRASPMPAVVEKPAAPVTSVVEMMDTTGLSVDEHFAKALGDTWHKLNNGGAKIATSKSSNSNSNNMSNVNGNVTSSAAEPVST